MDRYDEKLVSARKAGIKRGLYVGINLALVNAIVYASYALGFWYGVDLVVETKTVGDKDYDPAKLITVRLF